MNLKVSIPSEVVLEKKAVVRMVVETISGSLGILPLRLDCVACLIPGILLYETKEEGERFIAVDEGILTKIGPDVNVTVKNAVLANELGTIEQIVRDHFLVRSEQEKKIRSLLAKLESDFIRNLIEFSRYG
jgi:F-type H+-transporting ATPase subunit epsilon